MIYTVTLNPALDISGVVEELVPNEKSYVSDVIQTPGGNGVNAGLIASRLGAKVKLTGFLGGSNGKELRSLLKDQKMDEKFIPIGSSTRLNITVTNSNTHKQTRLSFPGPRIQPSEWKRLVSDVSKIKASTDLVILGGSLPPGVTASKLATLLRSLTDRGVYCMVDVPPPSLMSLIKARPSFIKPNLKEFQELTGSEVFKLEDVLLEMKKLHKLVPLICVSSVEGGAVLANENEAWFGETPKLKIKSTVGAGDSMVGAMSTLLAKNPNAPLSELLRLGLAASSATLSEPGLTLGSKKAIAKFLPQIKIKQLR